MKRADHKFGTIEKIETHPIQFRQCVIHQGGQIGRIGDAIGFAMLIAMMAVMLLMAYVVFLTSSYLERFLGKQGLAVFGRLLGVLLAALSVQYVADGVLALSKSPI